MTCPTIAPTRSPRHDPRTASPSRAYPTVSPGRTARTGSPGRIHAPAARERDGATAAPGRVAATVFPNHAASPWRGARAPSVGGHLAPRATFFLLASVAVSFLAGSAAPTPLYPLYQAAWGFSAITTTVVFGIYALAVLAALLVAGRLSDHVGRRPVLFVATLVQAAVMVAFATADGVGALIAARVVQGLSTGAAIAAVGAGLIDLDRVRGPLANAVAPITGTATGALVGGAFVHFLPMPTHLVYLCLCGVFVVQAAGVLRMRESLAAAPGAWRSLVPRLALPFAVRRPVVVAGPALVAVWSLAGLYGALGPAVVHAVFGLDASLFGGFALFVLAGSGGLAVVVLQRHEPPAMMALGTGVLLAGTAIVAASLSWHAAALFFAGTAVAGFGFGAGFQGAIRTIVPHAAPHERAGVLSIVFIVSYVSMGSPAVVAGYAIAHGRPVVTTAEAFALGVMALAACSVAAGWWLRRAGMGAGIDRVAAPPVAAAPSLGTPVASVPSAPATARD